MLAAWGVFYFAAAAVVTWPLVLHLHDRVPGDLGDPLLNVWILDWVAWRLPLTSAWWNAPQFFPAGGALAFSEHLLGLTPVAAPVLWLSGDPLLAYNVTLVASFALSALAAHVLGYVLTGRHDAAMLAGIAYGFSPYRIEQMAHLQIVSSYWAPLALVGLHLYFRDRHPKWVALFVIAWLMQVLISGYYLFFLSVLVGGWLVWFAPRDLRLADARRLAVGGAAAGLALLPILYGYWRIQRTYGMRRPVAEIESLGADLAGLLTASPQLWLWGRLQMVDRPESALFPGLTLAVLVLAGIAAALATGRLDGSRRVPVARALLLLAVVPMAAVLVLLAHGPVAVEALGVRWLSVSSVDKPFTLAVVLAAAGAALHPLAARVWRDKHPLAFYALAALVLLALAAGPRPTLLGQDLLYRVPAPYEVLLLLPGADGIRVPARFWMLASLCLAAAASLAFARLTRPRLPLAVALGLAMLAEGLPGQMPLWARPVDRPPLVDARARLHLPTHTDSSILYQAIGARRILVNGHSGYVPPHWQLLEHLFQVEHPDALLALAELGPVEVVVDREAAGGEAARAFVAADPHARLVTETSSVSVFRLALVDSPAPYGPPSGVVLPIAGVRGDDRVEPSDGAIDADASTRWHPADRQSPGQTFDIELAQPAALAGLTLELGPYLGDFPRELEVLTSPDGRDWTPAWSGTTGRHAVLGALADPRRVPLHIQVSAERVRHIRLRQLGNDDGYYWSIAELRAYGWTKRRGDR